MTKKRKNRLAQRPGYCMGFTFTDEQLRRMDAACESAAAYMRKYGRGKRTPLIDYRNYMNTPWLIPHPDSN